MKEHKLREDDAGKTDDPGKTGIVAVAAFRCCCLIHKKNKKENNHSPCTLGEWVSSGRHPSGIVGKRVLIQCTTGQVKPSGDIEYNVREALG